MIKNVGVLIFSLFVATGLLAACEQTQVATPQPVTITIAGATSMHPVLLALTSEFSRRHPSVIFDLRGGGSKIGEQLAEAGEVDLGATLLPPTTSNDPQPTSEQQLFHVPIGIDGVAIVVHGSNPINGLSLAELRDIFSGRTVNWSALGGNGDDILLISREDGSGARQLFESRVMGVESVSLTAVVMPTSADVVTFVSKNPTAIGYVSRAYVLSALNPSTSDTPSSESLQSVPIKVLTLEGHLPTLVDIKNGSYLLNTPLLLVGKGELADWNRQFIEFCLGPAGQQIVEKYHARIR